MHPLSLHRLALIAAVSLTILLAHVAVAPAAWPRPTRPPSHEPPVDAAIIDRFRSPACRWCPGNRGVDYDVDVGTPVRASASGVVTYAGTIGAGRYVTILHPDGLRTSYSFLATIAVGTGDRVQQGAVIGTTSSSFHFGVRRAAVYLDPEALFAGARLVPRLVPTGGAPAPGRALALARGGHDHRAAATAPPQRSWRAAGRGPGAAVRYHERPVRLGRPTNPRACRHLRSPPGAPAATPRQPQEGDAYTMAPVVTMRQLLEAGVHFGHQTRRWNPKMKRFIFGERSGIYIIDLQQTLSRIETAYGFVRDLVADGGTILFIGTKKQAQDPIRDYSDHC